MNCEHKEVEERINVPTDVSGKGLFADVEKKEGKFVINLFCKNCHIKVGESLRAELFIGNGKLLLDGTFVPKEKR